MSKEEPAYETEDECITDFFNNNLNQLKHYKSSFGNFYHDCCEKAHILNCQKHIKEIYLPLIEKWIEEYECIKESNKVQVFMSNLNKLEITEIKNFKNELNTLVNFLLHELKQSKQK
ncbi:8712_t:CDS:1 [Scutellospora calospora]|uniref:8712_t:CDS:1 n=1 Tax=Scutellospora calospora TaxID=85575 RepID=A0ACA9LPT2_9GLOM|nr:8712_t:CDS:1 [Scutellospora calospora]